MERDRKWMPDDNGGVNIMGAVNHRGPVPTMPASY